MPLDAPPPTAPPVGPYEVEVFFDGDCPLCRREIALLRRWDKRGRIRFTDIAAAGFDAAQYGTTQDRLMAEIHGRDAQGNWLVGVEAAVRSDWLRMGGGCDPLAPGAASPRHRLPPVRTATAAAHGTLPEGCLRGAGGRPKRTRYLTG